MKNKRFEPVRAAMTAEGHWGEPPQVGDIIFAPFVNPFNPVGRREFMLWTILLVILILIPFRVIPRWGHSRNWGDGPSGEIGLIVPTLIILLLAGRI